MKRLAAWASTFAVCTAFAGIRGMNFEHMPELKWTYGYTGVLLLIASTCGFLYYRFRRAGCFERARTWSCDSSEPPQRKRGGNRSRVVLGNVESRPGWRVIG